MDQSYMEIGMAAAAVVIGALHGYAQYKKTGKIGLEKTLELAPDVLDEVEEKAEELGLEKALDVGVDKIQELRGTKLGKTLRRKARARIKSLFKARKGK
jgi:hypothetical protein